MKKRLARLLCCLGLALLAALPCAAADQRVFDQAGLFTAQQAQQLESTIAELRTSTGMDWAILTVSDAGGKTSRQVADDFYDQNGLGTGSQHSGALFLIDMDNRQAYITTGGSTIDYLTDARQSEIFDKCASGLSSGDYAGAAGTFLSEAAGFVAQGVPSGQYQYNEDTGKVTRHRQLPGAGETALFAAAAAAVALVFRAGVSHGYSIKANAYVYPFLDRSKAAFSAKTDDLLGRSVTTRIIPRINSNGGGGGMGGGGGPVSTTHMSGGGQVHGGSGRGF